MMRRTSRRSVGRGAARERGDARAWLGAEIELIILERERLLQAAGAAASLFSALDPARVPTEARESVRRLGAMLEALPDETLTDAIEKSIAPPVRRATRAH